jgi:hypothetical protein
MSRIPIIDDDETMGDLLRKHLQHTYQIIDTGDAKHGIPVQVKVDPPSGQERQRHSNHWTDGVQRR